MGLCCGIFCFCACCAWRGALSGWMGCPLTGAADTHTHTHTCSRLAIRACWWLWSPLYLLPDNFFQYWVVHVFLCSSSLITAELTSNISPFTWSPRAAAALQRLKGLFTNGPFFSILTPGSSVRGGGGSFRFWRCGLTLPSLCFFLWMSPEILTLETVPHLDWLQEPFLPALCQEAQLPPGSLVIIP